MKVLKLDNLDGDSFVGEVENNELSIKHKINPSTDNMLSSTESGLMVSFANVSTDLHENVLLANPPIKWYGKNVLGHTTSIKKGLGLGFCHLDFILTRELKGTESIASLAKTCPTPDTLLEIQVRHSNGVGSIYIDKDRRAIKANNLPINERIIVDIIGYFS